MSVECGRLMQLQEPFLLVAAFALVFTLVIAWNRCNFRITKDAKWAAENRAEQAAHLLQEIGSIVGGTKTSWPHYQAILLLHILSL